MRRYVVMFAILWILLSGCSSATGATGTIQPTLMRVQQVNRATQVHYPPFPQRTVTDQQKVQQLYSAALALPAIKSDNQARFCPDASSLEYRLDFFQQQTLLQEMTFMPSGCGFLSLGPKDMRAYDESFIKLLAKTIGVTEAALTPRPLYSCTPHSPCPSPTPNSTPGT